MNVLHLINYTGGGGTESYIHSLAKKMKKGKKVKIYLAYSNKGDGYDKFSNLGIEMIELPMENPYDLKAAKKLAEICKKYRIDVVHTHFLRENYISILSRLYGNKAKLINTRHMLDENSKLVNFTNRFMTRFNHSIIAVSKAVEDLLYNELGRRSNIELIYNGIDVEDFQVDGSDLRAEFNLSNDCLTIISTARFSSEKGHEFLLKSLKHMEEKYSNIPDYRLILIGDGRLLEDIKNLSKKLGLFNDIIFTGYRSDVAKFLNISDFFICMSKSEAFGISILEAMASKLPVITSDIGGTREIIKPGSRDGILVEYGNLDHMAGAIYELLSNPKLREEYSRNGFSLVKNKFDLAITAEKTYDLYNK